MWSSRNRILIDTDGDDVAFLSGSGKIGCFLSILVYPIKDYALYQLTLPTSHSSYSRGKSKRALWKRNG